MSLYKPFDQFILRTPLLTAGEVKRLREGADLDKDISCAMLLGAPDFFKKYQAKSARSDESKEIIFQKYLQRLSGRVENFSIFSGVTAGELSDESHFELSPRVDHDIVLMEDRGRKVEKALQTAKELAGKEDNSVIIKANPSLVFRNKNVYYRQLVINAEDVTYKKRVIECGPLAAKIIKLASLGSTLAEMLDLIGREKMVSVEAARKLVEVLCKEQILLVQSKELQPKRKSWAVRQLGDLEIHSSGDELNEIDPYEVSGQLHKKAVACRLSRKKADEITSGAEVLIDLFSGRTAKRIAKSPLSRWKFNFSEKFLRREVPLLEALQLLPFPSIIGEPSTTSENRVSEYLRTLIDKPETWTSKILELSEYDLQQIRKLDRESYPTTMDLPASFTCLAQLLKDDFVYIRYLMGPPATKHFSRYAIGGTEFNRMAKHLSDKEAQNHEGKTCFDLLYVPRKTRFANVQAAETFSPMVLRVTGLESSDSEQELELSDLLVSYWGGRLHLRSKKLAQEVHPLFNDMYMAALDENPVLRFLTQYGYQRTFYSVGWTWEDLSGRSFLPRIQYRNFVFSPARWCLSAQESKQLRKMTSDLKKARECLREKGIPMVANLYEIETALPFDLEDDDQLKVFLASLKLDRANDVEEALQNPFDESGLKVRGPEGGYVSEISLPCFKRDHTPIKHQLNNYFRSEVGQLEIDHSFRFLGPTSGCLYFRLNVSHLEADLFLKTELKTIVERLKSDFNLSKWFFIRYSDPQHHIRLRLFSGTKAFPAEMMEFCAGRFQQLTAAGGLEGFQLDIYEREIERYGGRYSIDLFEKMFEVDSEATLKWMSEICTLNGESDGLRLIFALRSLDFWLKDLKISEKEVISNLDFRFFPNSDLRNLEKYFQIFKGARQALARSSMDSIQNGKAMDSILFERSKRLKPLIARLKKLELENRLGVGWRGLVESIIHMHINRLGLNSPPFLEDAIRTFLRKMLLTRIELKERCLDLRIDQS